MSHWGTAVFGLRHGPARIALLKTSNCSTRQRQISRYLPTESNQGFGEHLWPRTSDNPGKSGMTRAEILVYSAAAFVDPGAAISAIGPFPSAYPHMAIGLKYGAARNQTSD